MTEAADDEPGRAEAEDDGSVSAEAEAEAEAEDDDPGGAEAEAEDDEPESTEDGDDGPEPAGAEGEPGRARSGDGRPRHAHGRTSKHRINRRRFIGWTAAGAAAAAAAALGLSDYRRHTAATPVSGDANSDLFATFPTPKALDKLPTPGTPATGPALPVSPAIVAENAKTGQAWWVTTPQLAGGIEGYASQVSGVLGDTVTLYVSTTAPSFHVEAYRMGYYQGIGGRLIWQSEEQPGTKQAPPTLTPTTNTIECPWNPSLTVPIDEQWPPGAYLFKLVGPAGEQQFVPFCLRDDASQSAIVIQHSVTTWQAYNRWGGFSLYYGNPNGGYTYTHDPAGATYNDRARIVSFDRPYDHDWASGAADFVGNELPVIYQAEQLGLDVTYWTDIDLHTQPGLLSNHRALISLGHDEYWSTPMRDGATQALDAGLNLAFLGANACYRQIRLQPSPVGPNRQQICYKSAAEDPMTSQNPALVTVNWPQAPVSRPESQMIGSTYQDIDAEADMVISDPSSWLLKGVTLPANLHLPKAVQGEFDRYVPDSGPINLDVVCHSIVPNRGGNYSDVTWYTVADGGGVFATGNANWIGVLSNSSLIPPNVVPDATPGVTEALLAIMENLYAVIGTGPASITQPSQGNWKTVYAPGSTSSAAPNTVNAA
jgi:hypothetical protein